jgi:hypothetical protein
MDHGPAESVNAAPSAEDERDAGTEDILQIALVKPHAAHLRSLILDVDDEEASSSDQPGFATKDGAGHSLFGSIAQVGNRGEGAAVDIAARAKNKKISHGRYS